MKLLAPFLLLVMLAFGMASGAQAAEEIRSFHSEIDVGSDGTLRVSEDITVNVEGRQISRGIFRDIPVRYEDAAGRMREVDLDVVSVTRDGSDEPFAVERGSGVVRIRIGDAGVLLPHGEHVYDITYDTTRQIRFFEDHDELYWNVTGNGWDFPILAASAEIRLPNGAQATDVTYYTGPFGSTEQAASAQRLDGGNRIIVEADTELGQREGLTAVVAFPKGVVSPPTEAEERMAWLRENAGRIVGGIGLLVVLAYYFWAWSRVGRDPPGGVVVPRWTPPEGVSPALVNYIEQRGFRGQGWDAFSAAMINLGVKGHVELDDLEGDLTIRRKGTGTPADASVGEAAILSHLPGDGDELTVDKNNGERVQATGLSFRTAIEKEHRNRYYRQNAGYLVIGVVLSLLALAGTLLLGNIDVETMAAGMGVVIPAVIISIFAVNLGRRWRSARSLTQRLIVVVTTAFAGFIALTVLSGFGFLFFESDFDSAVLSIAGGLVITNVVFIYLMGAPTPLGSKLTEEIKGLKQYLTLAEQDRMNMQGAPQMSPRHFETLLPYAVALGVEKPWSRAFDAWLATATAAGAAAAAYVGPGWYHGRGFNGDSIGSSLGGVAGSLSNSFTASLPAPKSSSSGFSGGGGGGGFSGGGGGGGGGGGW
ncbi:DUF2207 domain-containing protein [Mesorhizobium sp. CAU 1741]|uniref:DUF2207 domain-containing protein n=1 Tax=Mesorhizobium sp. CAU 1741 TaxID=3140366 RepID=UPI00325A4463